MWRLLKSISLSCPATRVCTYVMSCIVFRLLTSKELNKRVTRYFPFAIEIRTCKCMLLLSIYVQMHEKFRRINVLGAFVVVKCAYRLRHACPSFLRLSSGIRSAPTRRIAVKLSIRNTRSLHEEYAENIHILLKSDICIYIEHVR